MQAIRSLDVPGSARRNLAIGQRQRGYHEGAYVESFVVLHALGGDCLDVISTNCGKILESARCWAMKCRIQKRRAREPTRKLASVPSAIGVRLRLFPAWVNRILGLLLHLHLRSRLGHGRLPGYFAGLGFCNRDIVVLQCCASCLVEGDVGAGVAG